MRIRAAISKVGTNEDKIRKVGTNGDKHFSWDESWKSGTVPRNLGRLVTLLKMEGIKSVGPLSFSNPLEFYRTSSAAEVQRFYALLNFGKSIELRGPSYKTNFTVHAQLRRPYALDALLNFRQPLELRRGGGWLSFSNLLEFYRTPSASGAPWATRWPYALNALLNFGWPFELRGLPTGLILQGTCSCGAPILGMPSWISNDPLSCGTTNLQKPSWILQDTSGFGASWPVRGPCALQCWTSKDIFRNKDSLSFCSTFELRNTPLNSEIPWGVIFQLWKSFFEGPRKCRNPWTSEEILMPAEARGPLSSFELLMFPRTAGDF